MSRLPRATREEVLTRTHKHCGTCRELKPLTDFYPSKRHGDGRRTVCKQCQKEQSAKNYQSHTTGYRDRQQKRYARGRAIIDEAKLAPCADCQNSYPPPVMHFHHRDPSTKLKEVAGMWGWTEDKLRAEIAKCDLLCANCHILRHIKEEDTPVLGI